MATNQAENTTDEKKADEVVTPVLATEASAEAAPQSVYAKKRQDKRGPKKRSFAKKEEADEFEQRMVDIARVTRVMAGGKRMRFRACVAIGDKKGKIGLGMAKGADVSLAVNKAVNNAKKEMIDISIVNETIPHEIFHKFGAAQVLLKPARQGRGVIAGGAIRIILELAGIKNITSKNLGTNNKVTISKCLMEALNLLKKVEVKKVITETKKVETPGVAEKVEATVAA